MEELSHMDKDEDEEKYRQKAKEGMDLMFPVSIGDKTHRPDINMPYHTTIKLFEPGKDNPGDVHERASQLNLTPPKSEEVGIEPTTLKGRSGNLMHVLKLHGPHAEAMRQHYNHFEGMGQHHPIYDPHITVDKDTWHAIASSGAKTAADAGIHFKPAELRHKDRVLSTYPNKKLEESENTYSDKKVAQGSERNLRRLSGKGLSHQGDELNLPMGVLRSGKENNRYSRRRKYAGDRNKLAATRTPKPPSTGALSPKAIPAKQRKDLQGVSKPNLPKSEPMEKGRIKNAITAMGVAGALAAKPMQMPRQESVQSTIMPSLSEPARKPAGMPRSTYDHKRMLNTIEQIESASGKLTHHKPTSHGTAYGKFGLMPDTIKETIHMNPDLRAKYGKATRLEGQDLHNFMHDNPELENVIADRHLQRLEHHFGEDPNKVGFAWNQGIRGAYNADPNHVKSHPYTKKVNAFYQKVK